MNDVTNKTAIIFIDVSPHLVINEQRILNVLLNYKLRLFADNIIHYLVHVIEALYASSSR